ncbi:MAG: lamin tail domain-containing protein [Polyangiaceae bacterium]|nr:lamin tail domain-containing protein [Polyangiaceae bacterium]
MRTEGTAGLKDDFVEIFNPTASPIDLAGYVISARSPTSNKGSDMERFVGASGQEIPAYGHLLVAGDSFDDTAEDATFLGGISLGNDTLVFLSKDGARLDVVCVCADHCAEPSWAECGGVLMENPATAVPKDISLHRVPPCVDTDNPVDFVAGDSSPLGLTSPPTPP